MSEDKRTPKKKTPKYTKTITNGTPIRPAPVVPMEEQETQLQPSVDDAEAQDNDWVISFSGDAASKSDSRVSVTQPIIADSRLGNKVIEGGKAKFGGNRGKQGSTATGFPRNEDVFAPGTMVFKYEIIKLLGRGGMGAVYVAHDTKLGRKVAIKFLSKKISGKEKFRKRFMIEAQVTAKLNHENVVTIYDAGEFQGSSYLVLEFLEGDPLTKIMKGRKLPAAQALHYAIPVVKALQAAHTKGIIHRDLKPDNIFVMKDGGVKVLDFGLAKMLDTEEEASGKDAIAKQLASETGSGRQDLTKAGAIMGTYAYMSPEQWGMDKVDALSDIYAFGVILFEMLTGEHPVGTRAAQTLAESASRLDNQLRGVREIDPTISGEISEIVSKCLQKRKVHRYQNLQEILVDLENADPNRQAGRRLSESESPYPGLSSFQERDADKFFGRDAEINRFVIKLRENSILAVIGPSGAGKSSFIRAGVIPQIKRTGRKPWDMIVIRPGRDPFAGLAGSLLKGGSSTATSSAVHEEHALAKQLRNEPGQLGTLLRARARTTGHPVMLFVDQFEETFTLVASDDAMKFTTALAGAAEDPEVPVRVVVAMRSDFLDRVAEYEELMEAITKDVTILQSPGPTGLHEAIIRPASLMGYSFEDPQMVEEMVGSLKDEPAALPLLQFTASKLWESRDKSRKILPRRVYEEMGGVGGALARHADSVLSGMTSADQHSCKRLFQRLVTSDGTRTVITVSEISSFMGPEVAARILRTLAAARLLTISTIGEHSEDAQVEIVHESLISRWATLKRWLEEDNENIAMLQSLREASKQWDLKGRPNGLLWTGDTLEEARLWRKKYQGELTTLETVYLEAALRLADRSARRKKYLIITAITIMAFVTIGAIAALFAIRGAEKNARIAAKNAKLEARKAEAAEKEVKQKMVLLAEETKKAKRAENLASQRLQEVVNAREQEKKAQKKLEESNSKLLVALQNAELATKRAEAATRRARRAAYLVRLSATSERKARIEAENAKKQVQEMLQKERETVRRLQALRSKIIQKLPERLN
ncbi:MAG: protein kinase [Deltaproteobacteria bacterium]|nr:protein kinase [Deltaproteobacteria bacterium]